jgi:UDP-N-acetylmuramoyl-tripeptide--D-alanyl-D-alanine ligase
MQAAIDFISEMPRKQGTKKIAVLGDMLELGAQSEHFHRKLGQYVIGKSLDVVYCLGEESRYIIEELRNGSSGDMHFEFFDTYEQVVEQLRRVLQQDDVVLLKGSRGMALENIINLLQHKD